MPLPPRIGPRYDVAGWFWRYFDYWRWSVFRERGKNIVQKFIATAGTTACVVLAAAIVHGWGETMHRGWTHFAMKERERNHLIRVIKDARERGQLPPSIVKDFKV